MKQGVTIRILICIVVLGFCLYSHIDKQNSLTHLRIELPALSKEVKAMRAENARLQYEIDQFEDPSELLGLARAEAFSHLKHPLYREVLTLNEGICFNKVSEEESSAPAALPRNVVIGVKP